MPGSLQSNTEPVVQVRSSSSNNGCRTNKEGIHLPEKEQIAGGHRNQRRWSSHEGHARNEDGDAVWRKDTPLSIPNIVQTELIHMLKVNLKDYMKQTRSQIAAENK